ncbi:zinc-dependent alcohol dehydrogenase family protein [Marinactinospora endophytica]
MLAALAREPGPPPSVVDVVEVEPGALDEGGSVRLRMLASTVNPSDLVTISGAYASRTRYPFVPGFEGVGEVVEVGEDAPRELLGRRVLPLGTAGNWQEYKVAPARWCFAVPDDVTTEDACFAYVNPLSALLMVDEHAHAGVRVAAVNGATSAIGGQLRALLDARGIEVIGLTSGATGRRVPSPADWSAVVSTAVPGWGEEVRRLSGGAGVDVAFDCVGGEHAATLLGAIRPGGALVHYGLLSGRPIPAGSLREHPGRRIHLFRLRDIVHASSREQIQALLDRSYRGIAAGSLRTAVSGARPLREIRRLIAEAPSAAGKLLVTFP